MSAGERTMRTELSGDDVALSFQTVSSGMIGRVVRLGPAVDAILSRHDYPEPVAEVLGQALTLAALLGTALKFDGRFILQTRTDGPLSLLVANFESPGSLRGYASFDADRVASLGKAGGKVDHGRLLGHGHLAMTIDPGGDMDRYQGIVALEGQGLQASALGYFRQSEQLPSYLRLAVGRHYSGPAQRPGDEGEAGETPSGGTWAWRAGGLLVQHLTGEGGHQTEATERDDGSLILTGEDDDDWQRTRILAATVEDHEMLDPNLAAERLLYRLFHEEGVRAGEPRALADDCRCTRERVSGFLHGFGAAELSDLREPDGAITVTCEFCNTAYRFEPDDLP